ncbi:MAG TPA: YukJ family protein, partial [Clostridia bacterium]|nr:YukJ family protein [Clostridia bacterium]
MPLKGYGVLKSNPISSMAASDSTHLEIQTVDYKKHYRIAVNVKSQTIPPELRYIILEDFKHPVTNKFINLKEGFTPIQNTPQGGGLDYVRGNLFDYRKMKLAHLISGLDNELLYTIQKYVNNAISTSDASIYAFGQSWGPEKKPDQYFGFKPGGGIHDIHMNQGNPGGWMIDNGVWQ